MAIQQPMRGQEQDREQDQDQDQNQDGEKLLRGQYCLAYAQPVLPHKSKRLQSFFKLIQSHGPFKSEFNDVSIYIRSELHIKCPLHPVESSFNGERDRDPADGESLGPAAEKIILYVKVMGRPNRLINIGPLNASNPTLNLNVGIYVYRQAEPRNIRRRQSHQTRWPMAVKCKSQRSNLFRPMNSPKTKFAIQRGKI